MCGVWMVITHLVDEKLEAQQIKRLQGACSCCQLLGDMVSAF